MAVFTVQVEVELPDDTSEDRLQELGEAIKEFAEDSINDVLRCDFPCHHCNP